MIKLCEERKRPKENAENDKKAREVCLLDATEGRAPFSISEASSSRLLLSFTIPGQRSG